MCARVQGRLGGTKDADMSPFESGRRLLDPASKQLSLDDRLNLVFQDADLVPLLVQARRWPAFHNLLKSKACAFASLYRLLNVCSSLAAACPHMQHAAQCSSPSLQQA